MSSNCLRYVSRHKKWHMARHHIHIHIHSHIHVHIHIHIHIHVHIHIRIHIHIDGRVGLTVRKALLVRYNPYGIN